MNRSHGHAKGGKVTPELRAWYGMIARCECLTNKKYPLYGGRGIRVCARWRKSFVAFFADVGPRPGKEFSIDRIKVDGNYEPNNVRWATAKQQQRNRSNNRKVRYRGKTMTLAAACEIAGLRYGLVKRRLQLGWSDTDALQSRGFQK